MKKLIRVPPIGFGISNPKYPNLLIINGCIKKKAFLVKNNKTVVLLLDYIKIGPKKLPQKYPEIDKIPLR